MSISNFIPTVWSARVQANLDKRLVAGRIVNRAYEQEAQSGTVKINKPGDVAVSSHSKGATITYGAPASGQKTLSLNQRKIAGFTIDDLDKIQANVALVEQYSQRMGYALADDIDRYIFSLYTGFGLADVAIDVTTVSAAEVRNAFADMQAQLNLNNVLGDPWVVLSPRAYAAMMKDTAITQATDRGDAVLESGALGRFMGFMLYTSNNLGGTGVTVTLDGAVAVGDTSVGVDALSGAIPAGTLLTFGGGMYLRTTAAANTSATSITVAAATVVIPDNAVATYKKVSKCIYGTSDAITFGMNMNPTVEALRDKDTTDDYVRSEQNYGALTLEPYAAGTFTTTELS